MMEHLFNGSAFCSVGDSGRVSLPPFVRITLERRSDSNALTIAPDEAGSCLLGYDRGYARILYADHERRRIAQEGDDAHHARARRTFGRAEVASFGASGNFTLPPMMRRKGKIEGLALFIGVGGVFEIWNPQLALASDDETLRELAAWRLEDHVTQAS